MINVAMYLVGATFHTTVHTVHYSTVYVGTCVWSSVSDPLFTRVELWKILGIALQAGETSPTSYQQILLQHGTSMGEEDHTVKKVHWFSSPQLGCHWPNSPWPGKILLFPARESLVSGLGNGKSITFFTVHTWFFLSSVLAPPHAHSCLRKRLPAPQRKESLRKSKGRQPTWQF